MGKSGCSDGRTIKVIPLLIVWRVRCSASFACCSNSYLMMSTVVLWELWHLSAATGRGISVAVEASGVVGAFVVVVVGVVVAVSWCGCAALKLWASL